MSLWVIERSDGKFARVPGLEHAYTNDLTEARTFYAKEEAQAECCEDERPRAVDDLIQRPLS